MTSRPVVVVAALLLAAVAPAQGIEDLLVESFPGPTLSVHFIDVGQGDAILIQTPRGKHVLVDSGPDAQARALTAYLDDLAVGLCLRVLFPLKWCLAVVAQPFNYSATAAAGNHT